MTRMIFGWSVASLMFVQFALGNALTNGINGINSAGTGLTGGGFDGVNPVAIGQVEPMRPGDPSFDTVGGLFHASVDPAEVFFRQTTPPLGFAARMDVTAEVYDPMDPVPNGHTVQVAGVMISTDMVDPDGPGPMVPLTGVSPGARLYAVGDNGTGPDFDPESALVAQHLASLAGVDVRAVNMSFGNPLVGANTLNGNQLLTLFVDWSAREHDILYVVAGNEGTMIPVPTDNFNGMTIAYSERVGSVWRRVSAGNTFDEDAEGDRTSIALLAPGDGFEMTTLGSARTMPPHPSGTSFAAPHVTGAVALLQEFANRRIAGPTHSLTPCAPVGMKL